MNRKYAILAAFVLFVLVSLLLIAATPLGEKPAKPNLDFSEGCLRGYLWDPTIQHIACSLPPTGEGSRYSPASGDTPTDRDANPPKDDGKNKKHPDDKKDDGPNGDDNGKSCPKADNTNKQGHHNCGKGPGPGEHDNGKRGGGHGKPDSQGKAWGRDK